MISDRNVEAIYPLSPMQQGMVVRTLRSPEDPPFVGRYVYDVRGPLDRAAFERAWQQVAARHAALRTALVYEGVDEMLQVVLREAQVPIADEDWSQLSEPDRDTRLRTWLDDQRRHPLDLSRAPLMRVTLVRLAADRHWLIWTHHHAVLDGWSCAIVLQEVGRCYAAALRGADPALPAARPYVDYIDWLSAQDGPAAEAWWRRTLSGFTAPTPLPGAEIGVDPVASRAGAEGEREAWDAALAAETAAALQRLAAAQGTTIGTIVLGAWALLLSLYTQEQDVVVGSVVSGRPATLDGVDTMVGLFINTLPVRVRPRRDETITAYLSRLQSDQVEAREFGYAALVDIHRWSDVPATASPFDTAVIVENYPLDAFGGASGARAANGLQVRLRSDHHRSIYPLDLTVWTGETWTYRLTYDPGLFSRSSIARLGTHLERLLAAFAATPAQRIADIDLLTPVERTLVVSTWNATAAAIPEQSVLEQIVAQAGTRPDAIAVAAGEGQISYGRLDATANRWARLLRAAAVGPEVCVGVCLPRGLALLPALLAIWKAGGVYVPLEPDAPIARVSAQVDDLGAPLVMTTLEQQARWGDASPARVLCVDAPGTGPTTGDRDATVDAAPLGARGGASQLAYVIYTSGSTGQPKGAMNQSQGLVNRLAWMQQAFALTPGDRVLHKTPIGFDVSLWELLWPGMTGACLVMARPDGHRDPAYLADVIRREQITVTHFVPSLLEPFVRQIDSARCRSLRQIVCSGEALWPAVSAACAARLPRAALDNLYGPTEAAIDVTWWRWRPGATRVPLGRPVSNTQTYVLDAAGRPAPIGVPGEIWLGGVQVGRGYWRRPRLTADRFRPDPFREAPGARLYRTGDRGRWQSDGTLDYLGRLDFQVKIRGQRIELGEIESRLLAIDGVRQAVAIVREQRLLAYVTGAVAPATLRATLQAQVPDALVPVAIVVLSALPLTANGKIDRAALPDAPTAEAVGGPPRTPVEATLARIWVELLRQPEIGRDDHFFERGGDSILAIQMVARAREAFGSDIPFRAPFDAPRLADLATTIDGLITSSSAAPPLVPVPRDRRLPLSHAQQRLWFVDQLQPGAAAYNIPAALRLRGPLSSPALRQALTAVAARHETLRTSFPFDAGGPWQEIAAPVDVPLPIIDLGASPDPEHAVRLLSHAAAAQPADLATGPLFRAELLRIADDDHVLIVTLHHIVSDGWSAGILVRDLTAAYVAAREGGAPGWAPLAVQYADYAVWQRAWLDDEVVERHLHYWREQLADVPALDLPLDAPRPDIASHHGAALPIVLDAELSAALRAFSRTHGVTLFMTLLAAYGVLLGRWAGQRDFAVGTDIANRTQPETEPLIGFFVNQLVLRADLHGAPTFTTLLARVRETLLGAYAHQELPFDRLVEALQPVRDLARAPIFQVKLVLQNTPRGEPYDTPLGDLRLEALDLRERFARFELNLVLHDGAPELQGAIEYRADLFEPETMRRLGEQFVHLLREAVRDPERRIDTIDLLTPSASHQVLEAWRGERRPLPPFTVGEMFERQVERTPDAIAIVQDRQQITYAGLAGRATQLARYLHGAGVRPDVRVGVCVERGIDLAVALLGVLQAGGAYVPLDADYPLERLAWMIEDAGLSLVLTQASLQPVLPVTWAEVIAIDAHWPEIARRAAAPAPTTPAPGRPANLAYIIYTSGSTGRPKGVAVGHEAVVRLVSDTNFLTFGADHVWLQFAPISFDASTLEIWGALLHGARLVVAPPGQLSLAELDRVMTRGGVSTLWLTAGLFHQMVDDRSGAFAGVRHVLAGGDVLSPVHVRRLMDAWPRCQVINGYGPTENTTFTCCHVVPPHWNPRAAVPIGTPITNTQVYVLDAAGQPVPPGVTGELHAGGAGVARGYWARPALTAARFVPDPFSGVAGARLYRTGDNVRWRGDGTLAFLGRTDTQVKVRGHRIELGEIETALLRCAGVRQAVVVRREDAPGDVRLVAWVVGDAAVDAVRKDLASRVPSYMIPGVVMVIDALPLTPNGKVDRQALPEPIDAAAIEARGPRTPVEEMLAGIFAEVLRRTSVDVEADFFALGGHSLLATQVVTRVRAAFGIDLPVRAVFETPTVAGLAEAVTVARAAGTASAGSPLIAMARTGRLPLSSAQQRLWVLDQMSAGAARAAYHLPAAVELGGALDVAALGASLTAVVRRHEALRTTFPADAGLPRQSIASPARVPLPVIDVSALGPSAESVARRVATTASAQPFVLAEGPLLRACLVRVAQTTHVLALTMHHIVSDGWSTGLLIKQVRDGYVAARGAGASNGAHASAAASASAEARAAAVLPPLPVQYADYAMWQQQWLTSRAAAAQIAYWRNGLSGVPAIDLPLDRPRPRIATLHGATRAVAIDPALTASLRALSRQHGVTLFMTLLAAFQVLLRRWSGQTDFAIGTDIANRMQPATEAMIGFFVNQLALRTALVDDQPFATLLTRVRDTTLDAYAHQDAPFDRVVDALQPERDPSRSPIFQVKLVLHNVPEEALHADDLRLRDIQPAGVQLTKVDLSFMLREQADGGIGGTLEYNTGLFEAATASGMLAHYLHILSHIAIHPETRVDRIPLMAAQERDEAVRAWRGEDSDPQGRDVARRVPLQAQIAVHAAERPDAIAIVAHEGLLTYAALNRRASQLASVLRDRGIGPDVCVAICLERGLDLVVAMLAVWKAGGAFVPLPPDAPADHLAWQIENVSAPLLLTHGALLARLPAGSAAVLCLDQDWPLIAQEPARDSDSPIDPANLAYVIYTSGSTGRPKAVGVESRNLSHYVAAISSRLDFTRDDRYVFISTPSADLGYTMLFPALASGGTLHVLSREFALDPTALHRYFQRHRPTCLKITPSHLRALTAAENATPLPERVTVIGGEASRHEWVNALRPRKPGMEFWNHYGPTETTVGAISGRIASDMAAGYVPLGRPLDDVGLYLLDETGTPVAPGMRGELFIGGAGVTRGYIQRPAATAAAFLPDPFGGEPGARMYRTGDIVHWRTDGRLEFVGRVDDEIKIRGYRTDPGEIARVLAAHPDVAECVVVSRPHDAGGLQLTAYITGSADPRQIRVHAEGHLLAHMVPAAIVRLDRLPLTANGKLDQAALPVPEIVTSADARPATAVETLLAGLWRQVLRVPAVGLHDSFFELGGDSILAIQVVARAGQAGVRFTVHDIFHHPTVAGLSVAIEVSATAAGLIEPTGPLPLTPVQHAFFAREDTPASHFNQSVNLRVRDDASVETLSAALDAVIAVHDALSSTFARDGARGWRRTPRPPASHVLARCDLSMLSDPIAALARLGDRLQGSLDLEHGPLVRAAYVRLGPQLGARLVLVVHHLAIDGVSWRILLDDLRTAYVQIAAGQPAQLAAPTVSAGRAAYALQDYAGSDDALADAEYWLNEDWSRVRPLPIEQTSGDNVHGAVASVTETFDPDETTMLVRVLPTRLGLSTHAALLSAVVEAIAEWSGDDHVLIDQEGHGREAIVPMHDLSRTVGWFTTHAPVLVPHRRELPADLRARDLHARLAAIPRHGLAFDALRHLGGDDEIRQRLAAVPSPEVVFNYLGQFDQLFEPGGLLYPAPEPIGSPHAPDLRREPLFEIVASVHGDRLRIEWSYATTRHHERTIVRLAAALRRALDRLIALADATETTIASASVALGASASTPATTPEGDLTPTGAADLDADELQRVLASVGLSEDAGGA